MRNFSTRWMMVVGLAGIGALALTAGCSNDSGNGGGGGSSGSGTGGGSGTADAGPPKVDYLFASSLQGWGLSTYVEVPPSTNFNLGGVVMTDGGTDAAAGVDGAAGPPKPILTFDSADGNPMAGSLQIAATFTDFNQYVDVVINPSSLLDLTKQPIITAEVRLTSGTFSGGGQIHVSTNADFSAYGSGALSSTIATPNTWVAGRLDLTTVTTAKFDMSMVAQIGVQLYSGGVVGDGGGYPNAGVPVVFNIDTVVSGSL